MPVVGPILLQWCNETRDVKQYVPCSWRAMFAARSSALTAPNIISISSRERPFVSGIKLRSTVNRSPIKIWSFYAQGEWCHCTNVQGCEHQEHLIAKPSVDGGCHP